MIGKKAISPLIAVVLLMVVVVGIGAIVTGISRNFVSDNQNTIEEKSDEMSCARDVMIETVTIDGDPQVCKGSNYVYIVFENKGSVAIDDFQMTVMGSAGFYKNESISASDQFTIGEAQAFNGTYIPASVGTIDEVRFIPKLDKQGQASYHFCFGSAIQESDLDNC